MKKAFDIVINLPLLRETPKGVFEFKEVHLFIMKKLIIILLALCLFQCKKTETIPAEPEPDYYDIPITVQSNSSRVKTSFKWRINGVQQADVITRNFRVKFLLDQKSNADFTFESLDRIYKDSIYDYFGNRPKLTIPRQSGGDTVVTLSLMSYRDNNNDTIVVVYGTKKSVYQKFP